MRLAEHAPLARRIDVATDNPGTVRRTCLLVLRPRTRPQQLASAGVRSDRKRCTVIAPLTTITAMDPAMISGNQVRGALPGWVTVQAYGAAGDMPDAVRTMATWEG